jgi:hypothetical protein
MLIQFERTGGFAGMRQSATIDTASLLAEQTRALENAIEAAHFFDLPAQMAAPAQAADYFHYRVTIEAEAKRHTVDVDEPAASPELQMLLQQLTQLARTARRT